MDIGSTYHSRYTRLGERHSAGMIWRRHHGVTSRSSLSSTARSRILSRPRLTALSHMTHRLPLPPATALHRSMSTAMLPALAYALDSSTPTSPPLLWLQLLMTRIPTPATPRTTYIEQLPQNFVGGRDQPQVAANPNAPAESWRRSNDARDNNDEGDDGDGKGERIEDAGSAESASLYTDFIDKHARACNNNNNNSSSHDIMDRNNPPPRLTPHARGLKPATTATTTAVPRLRTCRNIPTAAASPTSASTARATLPLDKRLLFGMYEAVR